MRPLFTIGVVTGGVDSGFAEVLINSIKSCSSDYVEVVLVGGNSPYNSDIHIPFDERARDNWITKKKNIITKVASGQFVVYCHDYIEFLPGWFEGFERFGYSFDLCMTPIVNVDGESRYRDWCMWPGAIPRGVGSAGEGMLLPYDELSLSRFMYFSGAYWIGRRDFMISHPLNERLVWGEGEDLEWSARVRTKVDFCLNPYSKVKLQKFKDPVFHMASRKFVSNLRAFLE